MTSNLPEDEKKLEEPKKKHRIVLDRGQWVMDKKTIQDRIQQFYG